MKPTSQLESSACLFDPQSAVDACDAVAADRHVASGVHIEVDATASPDLLTLRGGIALALGTQKTVMMPENSNTAISTAADGIFVPTGRWRERPYFDVWPFIQSTLGVSCEERDPRDSQSSLECCSTSEIDVDS